MSPGFIAWPLGMFSVDGTTAVMVTGSPSSAIAPDRLDHRGAARHVELHLLHLRRGLDRDAAGVEGHGLADVAEVGAVRRRPCSAARSAAARCRCPGPPRRTRPSPARRSPRGRAPRSRRARAGRRSRARAPARNSGVATFDGRFCRSRAPLVARAAATRGARPRPRRRLGPRPRATRARRAAAVVIVALGLEPVELVELEQRALDDAGRGRVVRGAPTRARRRPSAFARAGDGRGRDARASRASNSSRLPSPAMITRRCAAPRRVLVGHGDLAQPGFASPTSTSACRRRVGQMFALEQADARGCRRRSPRGRLCGR